MQLYKDHGFCFVCGKYAFPGELKDIDFGHAVPEPNPEDLDKAFEYIDSLPILQTRGLAFPADDYGYYVCWPDRTYYKKRLNGGKARYIGASGHAKPWFWATPKHGRELVIVEGEINAMSIAAACPDLAVVSPGGAGDFVSHRVKSQLKSILYFDTLLILTDADRAGALACIEMMGALAGTGKKLRHKLMPKDANDLLVERGRDGVRHEILQALEGNLEGKS